MMAKKAAQKVNNWTTDKLKTRNCMKYSKEVLVFIILTVTFSIALNHERKSSYNEGYLEGMDAYRIRILNATDSIINCRLATYQSTHHIVITNKRKDLVHINDGE